MNESDWTERKHIPNEVSDDLMRLRNIERKAKMLVDEMSNLKINAQVISSKMKKDKLVRMELEHLESKREFLLTGLANDARDIRSSVSNVSLMNSPSKSQNTITPHASPASSLVNFEANNTPNIHSPTYSEFSAADNWEPGSNPHYATPPKKSNFWGNRSAGRGANSGSKGSSSSSSSSSNSISERNKHLVWMGTSKKIYHSQNCKFFNNHFPHQLFTVKQAQICGARSPSKKGCCAKIFCKNHVNF
jgi:hypothetical protein